MVRGRGGRRSRVACARRRHGVIAHDAPPLLVRPPDAARDQRRAERRARDASVAGRDRRERRRRGVAVRRFVFGRDGDAALRDVVDLDRSVELVRDRDVACEPLRHPLAPVAVADPDLNSPRVAGGGRRATTQRRRKKRRREKSVLRERERAGRERKRGAIMSPRGERCQPPSPNRQKTRTPENSG